MSNPIHRSLLQWAFAFVLDVLIKSIVVVYLGLLVTLSGVPVASLVELVFASHNPWLTLN